jgi:hypothetical protein
MKVNLTHENFAVFGLIICREGAKSDLGICYEVIQRSLITVSNGAVLRGLRVFRDLID